MYCHVSMATAKRVHTHKGNRTVSHRPSTFCCFPPPRCIETLIIKNIYYETCTSGCYPRAVPKVGGILLIVKFKWITGNITLPRLARTGPLGASLPRCKSLREKLKVFQIIPPNAIHLVWVTNPPCTDKISYGLGFWREKSVSLVLCGEVTNLVHSSRNHWGSWSELWVCFTGCARICVHVIRTCAHTDAQMLEFQGAYERRSLGASVDERSAFKWLQWFCKSHISKDLQVCLQVCLPHLILMQKAVWCAHWCSVCPMGENALSRANFSFIFRDIKSMNRASLFKWG